MTLCNCSVESCTGIVQFAVVEAGRKKPDAATRDLKTRPGPCTPRHLTARCSEAPKPHFERQENATIYFPHEKTSLMLVPATLACFPEDVCSGFIKCYGSRGLCFTLHQGKIRSTNMHFSELCQRCISYIYYSQIHHDAITRQPNKICLLTPHLKSPRSGWLCHK